MRKWHRWLSVFFGVFLLWIAVTGTLSQLVPMYIDATSSAAAAEGPKPEVACPEGYTCRPKPKDGDPRKLIGLLHHLHSGESFGPLGVAIATLSGFAMIFFSFSGLWLYISMWRGRKDRGVKPGWFWK